MAESLYLSIDEDGNGFIELEEIISAKTPEEEKSINEDSDAVDPI